ncbi:ROK family protein, partial [bacterium]
NHHELLENGADIVVTDLSEITLQKVEEEFAKRQASSALEERGVERYIEVTFDKGDIGRKTYKITPPHKNGQPRLEELARTIYNLLMVNQAQQVIIKSSKDEYDRITQEFFRIDIQGKIRDRIRVLFGKPLEFVHVFNSVSDLDVTDRIIWHSEYRPKFNSQDVFIGLNIGSTYTRCVVMRGHKVLTQNSRILWNSDRSHSNWAQALTYDDFINYIEAFIKEVINKSGYTLQDVKAVGIGTVGLVKGGRILSRANVNRLMSEEDFAKVTNIRENLQQRLNGIPVFVEMDNRVMALGERIASGVKNALVVKLGTALAGKVIDSDGNISANFEETRQVLVDDSSDARINRHTGISGTLRDYATAEAIAGLSERIIGRRLPYDQVVSLLGVPEYTEQARKVFELNGIYLARGLAKLHRIFGNRYVVLSGKNLEGPQGKIIFAACVETLKKEYPGINLKVRLSSVEVDYIVAVGGAYLAGLMYMQNKRYASLGKIYGLTESEIEDIKFMEEYFGVQVLPQANFFNLIRYQITKRAVDIKSLISLKNLLVKENPFAVLKKDLTAVGCQNVRRIIQHINSPKIAKVIRAIREGNIKSALRQHRSQIELNAIYPGRDPNLLRRISLALDKLFSIKEQYFRYYYDEAYLRRPKMHVEVYCGVNIGHVFKALRDIFSMLYDKLFGVSMHIRRIINLEEKSGIRQKGDEYKIRFFDRSGNPQDFSIDPYTEFVFPQRKAVSLRTGTEILRDKIVERLKLTPEKPVLVRIDGRPGNRKSHSIRLLRDGLKDWVSDDEIFLIEINDYKRPNIWLYDSNDLYDDIEKAYLSGRYKVILIEGTVIELHKGIELPKGDISVFIESNEKRRMEYLLNGDDKERLEYFLRYYQYQNILLRYLLDPLRMTADVIIDTYLIPEQRASFIDNDLSLSELSESLRRGSYFQKEKLNTSVMKSDEIDEIILNQGILGKALAELLEKDLLPGNQKVCLNLFTNNGTIAGYDDNDIGLWYGFLTFNGLEPEERQNLLIFYLYTLIKNRQLNAGNFKNEPIKQSFMTEAVVMHKFFSSLFSQRNEPQFNFKSCLSGWRKIGINEKQLSAFLGLTETVKGKLDQTDGLAAIFEYISAYNFTFSRNLYTVQLKNIDRAEIIESMRRQISYSSSPIREIIITSIGGGSGPQRLAKGLINRAYLSNIVTVFDNGMSTGALRSSLDMPAVGDLRNRLVTLLSITEEGRLIEGIFNHRFPEEIETGRSSAQLKDELVNLISTKEKVNGNRLPEKIKEFLQEAINYFVREKIENGPGFRLFGSNVGNIILSGTYFKEGKDLAKAMHKIIGILGINKYAQIIPVSLANMDIAAHLENGEIIYGEHEISHRKNAGNEVTRIFFVKRGDREEASLPAATAAALEAIKNSNAVVIGPGSITSYIPNILTKGIASSLRHSKAIKILAVNISWYNFRENFTESEIIMASDMVNMVLENLRLADDSSSARVSDYIQYVLVNTPASRKYYHIIPDIDVIKRMRIKIIGLDFEDEKVPSYHSQEKISQAIIKLINEKRLSSSPVDFSRITKSFHIRDLNSISLGDIIKPHSLKGAEEKTVIFESKFVNMEYNLQGKKISIRVTGEQHSKMGGLVESFVEVLLDENHYIKDIKLYMPLYGLSRSAMVLYFGKTDFPNRFPELYKLIREQFVLSEFSQELEKQEEIANQSIPLFDLEQSVIVSEGFVNEKTLNSLLSLRLSKSQEIRRRGLTNLKYISEQKRITKEEFQLIEDQFILEDIKEDLRFIERILRNEDSYVRDTFTRLFNKNIGIHDLFNSNVEVKYIKRGFNKQIYRVKIMISSGEVFVFAVSSIRDAILDVGDFTEEQINSSVANWHKVSDIDGSTVAKLGGVIWLEDRMPKDVLMDKIVTRITPNNIQFVSREFVEGRDLSEILSSNISKVEKEEAVAEVIRAYLWIWYVTRENERGIFLGDPKPENIVLNKREGEWRGKVIDLDALYSGISHETVLKTLSVYSDYKDELINRIFSQVAVGSSPMRNTRRGASSDKKRLDYWQMARDVNGIFGGTSIEMVKAVFKEAGVKGNEKIGDIGSGIGDFCFAAAELYPNADITGMELSPELVRISKKIKGSGFKNVQFEQVDVLTADLSRFDVLYMYNPITWNKEFYVKFAAKLANEMKPGAKLISLGIDDPSFDSMTFPLKCDIYRGSIYPKEILLTVYRKAFNFKSFELPQNVFPRYHLVEVFQKHSSSPIGSNPLRGVTVLLPPVLHDLKHFVEKILVKERPLSTRPNTEFVQLTSIDSREEIKRFADKDKDMIYFVVVGSKMKEKSTLEITKGMGNVVVLKVNMEPFEPYTLIQGIYDEISERLEKMLKKDIAQPVIKIREEKPAPRAQDEEELDLAWLSTFNTPGVEDVIMSIVNHVVSEGILTKDQMKVKFAETVQAFQKDAMLIGDHEIIIKILTTLPVGDWSRSPKEIHEFFQLLLPILYKDWEAKAKKEVVQAGELS